MALLLMEGFDHLTAAQLTSKGWTAAASSMVAGRFAGQAAQFANVNPSKNLPSSYTTLICGFAFKTSTVSESPTSVELRAGSTVVAKVVFSSAKLQVQNGSSTVIATGTTALVANTWYYVELKIVVNTGTPASGSCELHLNGAVEIAATTGNFGSSAMNNILIGRSQPNDTHTYDDLYVCDSSGGAHNTFLGDVRVVTITPSADGAHSQFTPDSGSAHYSRVNETTADGDTSYVFDATVNDIDTYAFGDIDTNATIAGVQVNVYARKDDATAREIAPVIRQGGTDYVGTPQTLNSAYAFLSQLYENDPTGSGWTATNVNADEFGVKVTT